MMIDWLDLSQKYTLIYGNIQKYTAPYGRSLRTTKCLSVSQRYIHRETKNCDAIHSLITSTNVGRFSKFFHCRILQEICNKTHAALPTTPQICRCTTLRNVKEWNWRNTAVKKWENRPTFVEVMNECLMAQFFDSLCILSGVFSCYMSLYE